MKRMAYTAILLGSLSVGSVSAQSVDSTITDVGKIAMDNVSAGLSYFTRADGENFSCFGSSTEDKQRMNVPSAFTADQRKSYLSLVLTSRSLGVPVLVKFNRSGSGGACEIISIEMQN